MRTPNPGQFYNREQYWEATEKLRDNTGQAYTRHGMNSQLPDWTFDFISVHPHYDGTFGLLSPMYLVECDPRMMRPDFEDERFTDKRAATARARELGRLLGAHVVWCPDARVDAWTKQQEAA